MGAGSYTISVKCKLGDGMTAFDHHRLPGSDISTSLITSMLFLRVVPSPAARYTLTVCIHMNHLCDAFEVEKRLLCDLV